MTDMVLVDERKVRAAVDLLGRTGATSLQLRWSDEEKPVVYFAVGFYAPAGAGSVDDEGASSYWDAAAGRTIDEALLRLCERMVDSGQCRHCGKPTIFYAEIDTTPLPFDAHLCAYEWDPELGTFRRSCEGDGS